MAKQINTRVRQKIDGSLSWKMNAGSKMPLRGEILLYTDSELGGPTLKFGDGMMTVNDLSYIYAKVKPIETSTIDALFR